MSSQADALSDWNILPEKEPERVCTDLDCEKNPFLQMSQDQIQKLDAVLSSEQARALLRESSNDKLFSDSEKLDEVLSSQGATHGGEDNKIPAVLEETLVGVSLKDLERLVMDPTAGTELFPEATVGDMSSDILDLEGQIRNLCLAVWLDHSYALQPPRPPDVASVPLAAPVAFRAEITAAVVREVLAENSGLDITTELMKDAVSVDKAQEVPQTENTTQSELEQKDDDSESPSTRSGPRRRSQRQIEKTTREQVEKIRAENAELERKEREEMEKKVTLDTSADTKPEEENSIFSELEGVVSELSKKMEVEPPPPEIQEDPNEKKVKLKDGAAEKRKRKKSHGSESESGKVKTKGRTLSESSVERIKSDTSPTSKSPKSQKEGKTKRIRTNSNSVSPNKKLEDDDTELRKQSEDKSPTAKKKKVKKEKSYEEGPEPALFSFPDKMIKGKNDLSPDIKPQKKLPGPEGSVETGPKKPEIPVVTPKPEPKPVVKKESESVPPVTPPASKSLHNTDKPKVFQEVKNNAVVKKENDSAEKAKRTPSVEQKVRKVVNNVVKGKVGASSDSTKMQVENAKVGPDKPKPATNLAKTVKPKVLATSNSNPPPKDKQKTETLIKSGQSVQATHIIKTGAVKPIQKVKEKTVDNDKNGSKPQNRGSKNQIKKSKDSENIHVQKNREKRTIKKKPLDPNEIHPDEASDHEQYSDDPNDSDWDSEDDPEKLWCICKQPSNDRFMIQCDPCSNWFHGTCVGVTRHQGRQMEKDGVEWHCPQCSKGITQVAAAPEPVKSKPAKKEVEPKPKPTVKTNFSSAISNSQCIVCKSHNKKDSVYCGDGCIEQHVKEVLKLLQSSDSKVESGQVSQQNALAVSRVVVMERWTGKLYTGPNAPTREGLLSWLKTNPTFEALKPGPSSGTNSTLSVSKKAKPPEKDEKTPETNKKVDPEPVRLNVRKTLKEILTSRCKDADDVKCSDETITSLCQKIEEELYKLFKDTNSKYKSKYRSLMFNVKDPRNQGLFRKIVNRKIPPHQLVRMSPEELASKELAKWRERENQHALEMIKKDQLENQQMQSLIIKKTHKGEVEIEDDNLSILEQRTEERPEPKEEDMSDIKAMLSDTTSEHRMHLFDLNCQICTGRKAISELDAEKSSPEKRKIKVARTISLENPADSLSKDGPVVVAPKSVTTSLVQKDIKESKDKKSKKPKKKVAVMDEPSDHEPTSTVSFGSPDPELRVKSVTMKKPLGKPSVWKGFIYMLDVTKFVTSAHKVSGPTGSLSQEIPDTVQVCGRIPPEEVWSYLSKIKQGGTKELIVMRFQPANEEEKAPYEAFYNYLNSRKRYGVVRNSSKMIKDFYIIPLGSHSPVPTVLMPFDGPGLDSSRPNLLLGVIVRHKHKAKTPTLAATANPTVDKYDQPERSYTPPLDALPCQSTTVDSSISTNSTSSSTPALPSGTPVINPVPRTASPALSPSIIISSPTNIPGILSPSTLIPSSLIASILAPKTFSSGKTPLLTDDKAVDPVRKRSPADDEPYEPSYTPPLEKVLKLDEDKPYDPDDIDDLEVRPKVDVRGYLDGPSNTNPDLEAQKKLLAELTRQVEEQKEQIKMQETQLRLDSSDILLPEMLQSILKNIQSKSGPSTDTSVSTGSAAQTDLSIGNPIPVTVKPTSLSSMSAKELVERAQRELADLQKDVGPPAPKKVKHGQNPIPTIGDATSVSFSQNSTHLKAEPPPPGVDVEELVTDYNTPPPYYAGSGSNQGSNPYPALAPPFQQQYFPPPSSSRETFHQGPPPGGQPPPSPRDNFHQGPPPGGPPPPPPPPPPQQWGPPNRDSGPPPSWPVTPPGDLYYQGGQWNGPWNQPPPPPPPPLGWNGGASWNPHGRDTDARDSDLRMFQRRDMERHYNRDRNRK